MFDFSEVKEDQCFSAGCWNGAVCSSKTTWMHLSALKNEKIQLKCYSGVETELEVLLLKADLFFQHKFKFHKAFICDIHYNYLLEQMFFQKRKANVILV